MRSKPRLNVVVDHETMRKFRELCDGQGVGISTAVRALMEDAMKKKTRFRKLVSAGQWSEK